MLDRLCCQIVVKVVHISTCMGAMEEVIAPSMQRGQLYTASHLQLLREVGEQLEYQQENTGLVDLEILPQIQLTSHQLDIIHASTSHRHYNY